MARWMVEAIQMAKASDPAERPRAHSVRAYSSSWAHAKGLSLTEILNTVSWKSDLTFTKVYLKDVQLRTERGCYATAVLNTGSASVI